MEQPWRLRGAKVADAPARLDRAWLDVLQTLQAKTLVVGGRSAGARVACRTATELGARAVVCLAFPLHPPGRPDASRLHELLLPTVPVLVVQGERDAFGVPPGAVVIPGANHSFTVPRTQDPAVPQITAAVVQFLQTLT
ncbi:MAG: hydrolase [Frankiales bacterium]|nr:hydrolase [Frankiales bacterium]